MFKITKNGHSDLVCWGAELKQSNAAAALCYRSEQKQLNLSFFEKSPQGSPYLELLRVYTIWVVSLVKFLAKMYLKGLMLIRVYLCRFTVIIEFHTSLLSSKMKFSGLFYVIEHLINRKFGRKYDKKDWKESGFEPFNSTN